VEIWLPETIIQLQDHILPDLITGPGLMDLVYQMDLQDLLYIQIIREMYTNVHRQTATGSKGKTEVGLLLTATDLKFSRILIASRSIAAGAKYVRKTSKEFLQAPHPGDIDHQEVVAEPGLLAVVDILQAVVADILLVEEVDVKWQILI
jgi:hypothetical protein